MSRHSALFYIPTNGTGINHWTPLVSLSSAAKHTSWKGFYSVSGFICCLNAVKSMDFPRSDKTFPEIQTAQC